MCSIPLCHILLELKNGIPGFIFLLFFQRKMRTKNSLNCCVVISRNSPIKRVEKLEDLHPDSVVQVLDIFCSPYFLIWVKL